MIDPLSTEALRRADAVFAAALAHAEGARPVFLAEACAGDVALREEVELLLAADREASRFLESTWWGRAEEEFESEPMPLGGWAGPYRLLRHIGSGGMGEVFLAARGDDQFDRLVAVKLLRGRASADHVARLKDERQALALLEHPNIARLYDAGTTDDGSPFLVMELVKGCSIDRHVTLRRLSLNQRLALFAKVCDAVAFAHRNLLVHRDLKPANILVGEDGEPKLVDFGIVKWLAPSLGEELTRADALPRTPLYASPEQIDGGPITTATDVYGLGLVLYLLLTGRHPFESSNQSRHQLESRILAGALTRPSGARTQGEDHARPDRRLRGDLDAIALKALAREPSERYPSADALKADIERHLRGLPVVARAPSLRYQVGRWARRHRLAVALGLTALSALLGFIFALMAQRGALIEQRTQAEATADALVEVFEGANPWYNPTHDLSAADFLARGERQIENRLTAHPAVQARVLRSLAAASTGIGVYDRSLAMLERALALDQAHSGPTATATAATFYELGSVLAILGRFEEAEGRLRAAVAIQLPSLGPAHEQTLHSRSRLGEILAEAGHFEEARSELQAALEGATRAGASSGALAELRICLGTVLAQLGRPAEAEPMLRQALADERRAVQSPHPRIARALQAMALVASHQGNHREAIELLEEALRMSEEILGPRHDASTDLLNNLASAYGAVGEIDKPLPLLRRVLEISEESFGPLHPKVALAVGNLAVAVGRSQGARASEPLFRRAIEIGLAVREPGHVNIAISRFNLAGVLTHQGKFREAEDLFEESHRHLVDALGEEHPRVAAVLLGKADLYLWQGRDSAADDASLRALEILRQAGAIRSKQWTRALRTRADVLRRLGRWDEAEALLDEGRDLVSRDFDKDYSEVAVVHLAIMELTLARGQLERAAQHLALAEAIGTTSPVRPTTRARLAWLRGDLAAAQGNSHLARASWGEAYRWYSDHMGESSPYTLLLRRRLES